VKALEEFQDFFSRATQTAHGIYALYRREKLYYVGLARNLRARLKNHLRDRHRDQWDRFSIYLTSSDDYIRELESLVLRIVSPPGNRVMGKFPGAANLRRKLQRYIRWQAREREQLLLGAIRRKPLPESRRKLVRPLRGKFGRNMTLRGQINGVTYSARLLTNGAIVVKRKRYNTPTEAALASVRHRKRLNGWRFWMVERTPGEWVRLRELLKRPSRSELRRAGRRAAARKAWMTRRRKSR